MNKVSYDFYVKDTPILKKEEEEKPMETMTLKEHLQDTFYPKSPWQVLNTKKDIDVSLHKEGDTLTINFKGSDSLIDWIKNFDFFWLPYKNMDKKFFLHRGFASIYHTIRDQLHEIISYPFIKNVIIEGFSHGGALTTICYADLIWQQKYNNTFTDKTIKGFAVGSPRVCSIINAKYFDELCEGLVRVENTQDLVTRVPFTWMLYTHASKDLLVRLKGLKKRRFWPLTAQAVYEHINTSYLNRYDDSKFIDTKDNNERYKPAVIAFRILHLIGFLLLIILGVSIL